MRRNQKQRVNDGGQEAPGSVFSIFSQKIDRNSRGEKEDRVLNPVYNTEGIEEETMSIRHITWEEIVLRILGDRYPHEVELQTIYAEVGKHTELTNRDLEETRWGELRYEHTVRATLCNLVRKGMAERIRRGVYAARQLVT